MTTTDQMTTTEQTLRVHWVLDELMREEDGRWNSVHASNRARGLLPAEALQRLGHQVDVSPMGGWLDGATDTDVVPDVVIVGRLFVDSDVERYKRHSARVLRRIRKERLRGVHVLADICDDHVEDPAVAEHWRSIVRLADACVVGSKILFAQIAPQTKAPVRVIDDPLSSPRGQPAVFRSRAPTFWQRIGIGMATPLRLCWYGNTADWPAMQSWMDVLAKDMPGSRLLLRVVTAPCEPIQRFVREWNARNGSAFKVEHIVWDQATQWDVVEDSDVVLLPSDATDPQKAHKSGNRLADALHTGRFVIASPIETYQPYAAYAGLTEEPAQALQAYLGDPDASLARVLGGQALAVKRCGVDAIAKQWMLALDPRASKPTAAPGTAAQLGGAAPVRLNLGCGDKILPGYENVDVVASRLGRTPDVLCDLHDLAVFPDDYADEVMAIHVVEHFWRWEIEDVLREWLRVLKPGGSMVLECPNLISACEEFLRDPQRHSGQGQEGQRTMWVFYGDPAWKDPYMNHRWGYTPDSLKALLETAGLVEVRQEPARYKLREPRDMRVVGVKPR